MVYFYIPHISSIFIFHIHPSTKTPFKINKTQNQNNSTTPERNQQLPKPIPSMGRTVYLPTNFTIKINHSWIGKYTNPMDGMGTLKRPPFKSSNVFSPQNVSPRGLRLFKYHSIGHSHFTCCGLLCLWCFCFNFRAFGGTKRSPMEVFGG